MCAQTRSRFTFSSERVLGGMESEPMLTPREKSPLLVKFSPEEDSTHDATSNRTASPTHYQRAIPAPKAGTEPRSAAQGADALPLGQRGGSRAAVRTSPGNHWSSETMTYQMVLWWLSCQTPGVTGKVFTLVGQVSAQYKWMR